MACQRKHNAERMARKFINTSMGNSLRVFREDLKYYKIEVGKILGMSRNSVALFEKEGTDSIRVLVRFFDLYKKHPSIGGSWEKFVISVLC